MKILIFLIFNSVSALIGQNQHLTYFDVNSSSSVIDYMEGYYSTYVRRFPIYSNAVVPFNAEGAYTSNKYVIKGGVDIRDGYLVTIKVSESVMLVFLNFNVYELNRPTNKALCFYAKVQYGEMDPKT